jgi:MFS family permease
LPVGLMFDRYGVRTPTVVLMAIGALCAALLSITSSVPLALVAQAGLGLGCAPIFMGLLNHVLRTGHGTRNVRAVTTASAIGMAGALLAAYPLSRATASVGWRPVMLVAALAMLGAAIGVMVFVQRRADPAVGLGGDSVAEPDIGSADSAPRASLRARPAPARSRRAPSRIWTLMPACLAMSVGSTFRTSWGGPYLADVFGFDVIARGNAMTVTSLVGITASFCVPLVVRRYAPKRISLAWLVAGTAAALLLALLPAASPAFGVALICVLFSVGCIHPLVMSQARAIIAPQRLGLGLGVLNSLVFLGIALTSACFGWIAEAARHAHLSDTVLYGWLFAVTAVPLAVGAVVYFFSPGSVEDARAGAGTVVSARRG